MTFIHFVYFVATNSCSLLKLPDIDFQTISVHFTERERSFYEALRTKSQSIFQMYVDAGVATKSWFQIFSLLQRLRQACDHMALTAPSRSDTLSDGDLSTVAVEECTDADVANLNVLDTACIVATPFCEDVNDPFRFVEDGPSAKLQAILDELEKVWTDHPNCKVLIFSQYLGFLDLLEKPLRSYKIQTLRLEGKMSMRERQQSLNSFAHAKGREVVLNNNSKSVQSGCVFLMSMKAGGVGLNLTCASCVFIADPWWHAAMDEQCINRVHRIGQKANVVLVRKFIVEDSVEEKILILQKRKKALSSQILGDHVSQLDGQGKSNPTLDDFNILFGR
jgi:SNF2 family DNA or RNA helicase